jgi:outer membrane protein assembly factor BamB
LEKNAFRRPIHPTHGAEKINIKKTITTLLILTVILGIGAYIVFQQRDQNAQQSNVDWSPTFHHDLAHTGHSTSTGPLTNQTLWSYLTENDIEYPSPAVVDGVAYFGSNDYRVHAVNASTGSKIWSYLTGSSVESSCTVADGIVYFGSDDNNVYALDATTGGKIWNFTTKGDVYSTPAVVDGVVYVGSTDHNLYALDAATGSKIWSYLTSNSVYSAPAVVNG